MMKTKIFFLLTAMIGFLININAQTVLDAGPSIYINGKVETGNFKHLYLNKSAIQDFHVDGNYLVININEKAGTDQTISRPILLDYRNVNGGLANITALRTLFTTIMNSRDAIRDEFIHTPIYIESYVITDTTAYLLNTHDIVYFSFFTYSSNTGRVMFDGRHNTFNGQSSEPVYIPASTSFNNGDRIEMLNDSVMIAVPALDTIGLFLWRTD